MDLQRSANAISSVEPLRDFRLGNSRSDAYGRMPASQAHELASRSQSLTILRPSTQLAQGRDL